jgi:outer membrane protein assembly factor BamB
VAVGATAVYVGADGAAAVDLALGRERWRTPLPAATTPVAVAAAGDAAYALVVPDRGGPARVLRFDLGTGVTAAEAPAPDAATALWVGPGVVVLTTTTRDTVALA